MCASTRATESASQRTLIYVICGAWAKLAKDAGSDVCASTRATATGLAPQDAARRRPRDARLAGREPSLARTQGAKCALHTSDRGRREAQAIGAQDWLKKPFSISRARSSAEISTLRGVSMNTLSAIRCMPPSSA